MARRNDDRRIDPAAKIPHGGETEARALREDGRKGPEAPDPEAHDRPVVLSVRHLKKRIGKKCIIRDVTFDVRQGEVFGFLGPNGAGKTTTIRMLVDLIRPTEGTVTVCGHDVHKEHFAALAHVGCIVENPELYPFLTGWENLEQFAAMLPGVRASRIREVAEIVGLDRRIHDKVKTYSLGMRQRLGIAQALLGDPKLLILDEPTNGLDPQGIKELREFIRRIAADGMAVFVSSHLLGEVELMCDRVAVIRRGEVVSVGTVGELLSLQPRRIAWTVDPADAAARLFAEAGVRFGEAGADTADATYEREETFHGAARNDPSVAAAAERTGEPLLSGKRTLLADMAAEAVPDWNRSLVEAGVRVHAVEVRQPTLEELFLRLTEGDRID
jgi:ABC-2 type transport system ATP-binding protein